VKKAWAALVAVAVVAGSIFVALDAGASSYGPVSSVVKVWTEPQSGYGFLQDAIVGAHRTIDISMYELSDKTIEDELIARARAGVIVRVLLNSAYYGRSDNALAAALLRAGFVHVAWAPSGQIFHAKYVVVDDRALYLGTGNLVTRDYSSTRDFWVEDTTARDVAAATATFSADFSHDNVAPQSAGGLVWSPGSTSALVNLIDSARTTLLVENEEMDNTSVEQALSAAARRGVNVKVVMTYSSEWTSALAQLKGAGVKVSTLGPSLIYIHAKVICADCTAAGGTVFIGSENFSTSSLSYNRELGVLTTSSIAIRAVTHAVDADYALGRAVA
jgi:phosphatidylserine/phosphatidylglycerophosphate/cardiolipin synthase-like enzyme